MVKPAVLAAAYPSWIRYEIPSSLIKKVNFPRFAWPVQWMQKSCDRNTMQYVLTLLINIPKKTNLSSKIVKEEDPEIYPPRSESR
jgi:hypothetical protein